MKARKSEPIERVVTAFPCWAVTKGPKHHFFGYYDKCPWDATGRYLFAMEVDFNDRMPEPDDVATIGLIDLQNGNRFEPIAETRAWNWQQGCMLQWVPSAADRLVIYNDRRGEDFVGIILDVQTGAKNVVDRPIYAVSPDGQVALSVSFSRLHHVRPGYGYAGLFPAPSILPAPADDGILRVDLNSGESELLLSLADLSHFESLPSMENGMHWTDHLQFNPDGSRFAFLHRWQLSDGGHFTRLMTAAPDGSNLRYLTNSGMFSHYDWLDSHRILGWGRASNFLSQARLKYKWFRSSLELVLPVFHALTSRGRVRARITGDCYLLIDELSGSQKPVGVGVLTEDGHCTWSPDRKWILTDTYPDKRHYRTLIMYEPEEKRRLNVAKLLAPPELRGGIRCDLHPRWNRSGTEICIDSAHDGSRQMYILAPFLRSH